MMILVKVLVKNHNMQGQMKYSVQCAHSKILILLYKYLFISIRIALIWPFKVFL